MSRNKKRPRLYFIPETELARASTYTGTRGLASYSPRYANCSEWCRRGLRGDQLPCSFEDKATYLDPQESDFDDGFLASDLRIGPPGGWTPPRAHSTLVAPSKNLPYFGTMQDTVRSVDLDQVLSRFENSDVQHWPGMHNAMAPRSPFASSQHSLVSGNSKYSHYHHNGCINCGHWNNYCKVFLITCVILLFAWGVAVPVFFTVGKGSFHSFSKTKVPAESVAPALKLQTAMNQTNVSSIEENISVPMVPNVFNCSITIINRHFTPDMNNPRSHSYLNLKKSIEQSLTNTFKDVRGFQKIVVKKLSPEKIRVSFIAIFDPSTPVVRDDVVGSVIASLLQQWTMMGMYQIDVHSLHINYLEDQCATSKGGCSHSCQWNGPSASHLCLCPAQLTLDVDDRTCRVVQQAQPKLTQPRWPSRCRGNQFSCENRKCIPRRWLCDKVADCPRGEDEDIQICGTPKQGQAIETRKLIRNRGAPRFNVPIASATKRPPPMWHRFKTPQSRRSSKPEPGKFVIHDELKASEEVMSPTMNENEILDMDAYLKNGSGRNSLHYLSKH